MFGLFLSRTPSLDVQISKGAQISDIAALEVVVELSRFSWARSLSAGKKRGTHTHTHTRNVCVLGAPPAPRVQSQVPKVPGIETRKTQMTLLFAPSAFRGSTALMPTEVLCDTTVTRDRAMVQLPAFSRWCHLSGQPNLVRRRPLRYLPGLDRSWL